MIRDKEEINLYLTDVIIKRKETNNKLVEGKYNYTDDYYCYSECMSFKL